MPAQYDDDEVTAGWANDGLSRSEGLHLFEYRYDGNELLKTHGG